MHASHALGRLALSILLLFVLGACSGERYSQLQKAAANGQTALVQRMLEDGADPNETNARGRTALMMAAANGQLEVVRLLLARQAVVDAQDEDGMTALMVAAAGGHARVVETLLAHGAQINLTNAYGVSALEHAALFGKAGVVRVLLSHSQRVDQEALDEALLIAAGLGFDPVVKLLLEGGAQVDARGKQGRTPLMAAIAFEHPSTVALLLAHGADRHARDEAGTDVLSLAREQGNDEILRLLNEGG